MSTIAIGDIHGHVDPLQDVLSQITGEVDETDTVVFLGDYIDRGPSSKDCLTTILAFREQTPATVVCLMGNHEEWLLKTMHDYRRHSWLLAMDAFETIYSYSPEAANTLKSAAKVAGAELYLNKCGLPYEVFFDILPPDHRQFLDSLALSHRTADCLCAHAGVDPAKPFDEEHEARTLVWGVHSFPDRYMGTETVVYGHMNNAEIDESGWPQPRIVRNTIGLDTIGHGVLTAIRLPDRTLFQSRLYPSAIRKAD
jgi:serine/threonine protein phosphatase 1